MKCHYTVELAKAETYQHWHWYGTNLELPVTRADVMAAIKACLEQTRAQFGLAAVRLAGPSLFHSLSLLCFRGSSGEVSNFKSQRRRAMFYSCRAQHQTLPDSMENSMEDDKVLVYFLLTYTRAW